MTAHKRFSRFLLAGVAAAALATTAAEAQAVATAQVDISPQSLSGALNRFGRQTGTEVIFAPAVVRGYRAPLLRGAFTVEQALDRLLAGTGLRYRRTSQGAYVIEAAQGDGRAATFPEAQTGVGSGEDPDTGGSIVVTGSRIRSPNLASSVPVTSVTGETFIETGQTAIGDVLNELPALRSTISQSNSTRLLGTPGINQLDLRGLGINRTLVLQNGRRLISGSPANTSPDVNTIPTDLIERVDIVTGGSSAIYGSDAIAGVVNFVLRRDYDGIQVRGQSGITPHGDAGQYDVSLLAGRNFADGRGNIAINVQYTVQEDWFASRRDSYRILDFFIPVDFDDPGDPNGSDSVPDREYFRDVREVGFSNGGQLVLIGVTEPDGFAPVFNFLPDGTLTPLTGDRISFPPFGARVGGNGATLLAGDQFGLYPRVERLNANLLAHYEVSDALELFVEGKYVRIDALGSSTGPFFDLSFRYFTDNPYLNPETAQLIRDAYGLGPGQETSFFFGRNFLELGTRKEESQRDTYRIVVGARGDLGGAWSYEVSANYSELNAHTRVLGDVNQQRYQLAADAVRAPNGQIVCRSQIDPAARVPFGGALNPAVAAARLAEDVAACVPLNPFGEGNITPAARDYLLTDSNTRFDLTQFVASAFLTGNLGQWFELPGGPVGIAVGAEYRRETFLSVQDELVSAGLTFYNAQPAFNPPPFEVKELFGEIRIPLLARRPFFEELTFTAAARLADYNGGAGTVLAWNGGVQWAPVRDLRFRANYARAVRAPNLVETFSPLGQSFSGLEDPCSIQFIGAGSSNRQANCAADGVPAGFDIAYIGSTFEFRTGGNPDLEAERSDSWTIGAVFQPSFIPGLSLTVDYYDITVDNVIATISVQDLVNTCYDSSDIDNNFCALFDRFQGPGAGPGGEIPGQIVESSLILGPVNFAALKVRGIDVELAYRRQLEGIGTLSTRLTYTHVLQNDTFLDPTDPNRANQVLYELGDPRDAFNWNVNLRTGPVTFGYQLRYIGRMSTGPIENIRSVQGRPPQDADAFSILYYPEVFYHDFRIGVDVGRNFNFYLGVDNAFDRLPPLNLKGIGPGNGDDGAIFNNIGRFFYVGAIARF